MCYVLSACFPRSHAEIDLKGHEVLYRMFFVDVEKIQNKIVPHSRDPTRFVGTPRFLVLWSHPPKNMNRTSGTAHEVPLLGEALLLRNGRETHRERAGFAAAVPQGGWHHTLQYRTWHYRLRRETHLSLGSADLSSS